MTEYHQLSLFPPSALNADPLMTWGTSGLSFTEQIVVRSVAEQFPDGAYAAFVRLMDERELKIPRNTGADQ